MQESPSANAVDEPLLFTKDDEVHVPCIVNKKFPFIEKIMMLPPFVIVSFTLYSWGAISGQDRIINIRWFSLHPDTYNFVDSGVPEIGNPSSYKNFVVMWLSVHPYICTTVLVLCVR